MITDEAFRQAVKAAIAEHKKDRNIAFTWEGQTYWIKRRLSNGRNQFAKSSVNVQFYTEIALVYCPCADRTFSGDCVSRCRLHGHPGGG